MGRRLTLPPFTQALLALQHVRLYDDQFYPGIIREVKIHWPTGCNSLVDVAVFHGNTQFLPQDGFIALDGTTETWFPNEPITAKEHLAVDMTNHDPVWPHTPSVVVTIELDLE